MRLGAFNEATGPRRAPRREGSGELSSLMAIGSLSLMMTASTMGEEMGDERGEVAVGVERPAASAPDPLFMLPVSTFMEETDAGV